MSCWYQKRKSNRPTIHHNFSSNICVIWAGKWSYNLIQILFYITIRNGKHNILALPSLNYKVNFNKAYSFLIYVTCYNLLKYPALVKWFGRGKKRRSVSFVVISMFFKNIVVLYIKSSMAWISWSFLYSFFIVWWRAGYWAIQQLSLILIIHKR